MNLPQSFGHQFMSWRGQVPWAFGINKQRIKGCLLHHQIEGVVGKTELGHVHLQEGELRVLFLHVGHADRADINVHHIGVAGLVQLY